MSRTQIFGLSFLVVLILAFFGYRHMAIVSALGKEPIPAPSFDEPRHAGLETAVFAGGCFWGTQTVFGQVKGVTKTVVGYAGGKAETATYDQVTNETTGHAESVEITFDPEKITYGTLLRIFFSVAHDPTELNRQGPDEGTSYRSAIFYANDEQRTIAETSKLAAAGTFKKPIVTEIVPVATFYPAENYHQDYYNQNKARNSYCAYVITPKLDKLHLKS